VSIGDTKAFMAQKPSSFKTSLVFKNRTMAYFYSQIEQQQRILQMIRRVLPDNLAKQTKHCLIKERKLLIYTDSAVWATQLRFYNTTILASVTTQNTAPIESLQIKVISTQTGLASTLTRKALIPSTEKIEALKNNSLSIEDNQLRLALLKLSTTLERLSNNN
jgi:hypothetical protein